VTPSSGMCVTCVDGCIGMCEIGKSAYRGAEVLYPQPFGIITAAGTMTAALVTLGSTAAPPAGPGSTAAISATSAGIQSLLVVMAAPPCSMG
jgi:hypothetical protein